MTASTLSRWTGRTRPRRTSGLGRGGGTAYAALETAVDAGTGAVEGAIYAVRVRRTLIWKVVWLAYLLSPVPSRSPFSRLVRFPPLFLPFFLSGCSLFMVYSFLIPRSKMLSAADFWGLPDHELSHCGFWNFLQFRFNGFCVSLRPRRFGGNGSLALERAARAQGRLEASHIGNSGRCKRARSCESASSGASQNSFSIMGQGDPCTLF